MLFGKAELGVLKKVLANKGYETILEVSKKGMKPDQPADFSESIKKIAETF